MYYSCTCARAFAYGRRTDTSALRFAFSFDPPDFIRRARAYDALDVLRYEAG